MTAPVMQGATKDNRPFIAIKVDRQLSDEDIEKLKNDNESQGRGKNNRKLEHILVLYQYLPTGSRCWGGIGEYMWREMGLGGSKGPSFFTLNFTCPENGNGPTPSQKGYFEMLQTLLKTGTGPDNQGQVWRIPV